MPKPRRTKTHRTRNFEALERREVMSADPLANLLQGSVSQHTVEEAPPLAQHGLTHHTLGAPDFWLSSEASRDVDALVGEVQQTLTSAHNLTGMTQVRTNYGFTGAGQTVAVIDSGIAYNHGALGGGLGASYRVVGGWDFAENDADPYDDGDAGSHGTHVAGIVGANSGANSGVASGVDLVGLRVFNDAGDGYFSWVEQALRWVHQNRNAFENPITAVNLSLGTEWNSATTPSWAMLEDEFAQLKADGIFVAVSAGNSYTNYNAAGLSYPAASPHVVPVMSVDDNGALSYFSQRHTRALAAPGRYIYSTVPDYAGNHNGQADDWANFSGTSMASPYVAGASVIVRQAMEFAGMTGITQDTIYNHMMATADSFYDASSAQTYKRLNMNAAITALMPTDDFGSTTGTAHSLGTLSPGATGWSTQIAGHIGTVSDADFFTFTAGATGTVTFSVSNPTAGMAAAWQGGAGALVNGGAGYRLNVTAGQTYTVGLTSSGGVGRYTLGVAAESSNPFTYTDLGVTGTQTTHAGLSISGDTYYRIRSSAAGILTVQATPYAGSASVTLLSAGMQALAGGGSGRADYYGAAGQDYYIRVSGASSNVDLKLTNALSFQGGTLVVSGGSGDDVFSFAAGASSHLVSVNGASYALSGISAITLAAGVGNDSVTLTGTSGFDTATLRSGQTTLVGSGYSVTATGFESTAVHSGGGGDVAYLYDTAGDDQLALSATRATLTGSGATLDAHGFKWAVGMATAGGTDTVTFADTAGNDAFVAWQTYAKLTSADNATNLHASGFEVATATATAGGVDSAYVHDSGSNDSFVGRPDTATMTYGGGAHAATAAGFDAVYSYAIYGGADTATLYDSAGDDRLEAWMGYARFGSVAGTYRHEAFGFDHVMTHSTAGGADTAYLHDSSLNDQFTGRSGQSTMAYGGGASGTQNVYGFQNVYAWAVYGGTDTADVYDSALDDLVYGRGNSLRVTGDGRTRVAAGFEQVNARLTGGGANSVDVAAVDYYFQSLYS